MPRFEVKLTALSTWSKVVIAKNYTEAIKKAQNQARGWARSKWVHFTQEASEPDIEQVN